MFRVLDQYSLVMFYFKELIFIPILTPTNVHKNKTHGPLDFIRLRIL
jgi:hypothetical protein